MEQNSKEIPNLHTFLAFIKLETNETDETENFLYIFTTLSKL